MLFDGLKRDGTKWDRSFALPTLDMKCVVIAMEKCFNKFYNNNNKFLKIKSKIKENKYVEKICQIMICQDSKLYLLQSHVCVQLSTELI